MRNPEHNRARRGERGQAIVEFAFTALIFFTIIFGVVDLGRAIFEYNILASSAREGARMAIVHYYTDSDVTNRVVQSSAGFINSGDVTINPSGSRTCTSDPCPSVTVSVQHTFTPVTPLIGTLIGGSITLRASSTMVVER
jgi:Flp pilus assembly protein TadG